MADYKAQATGNWSATGTWSGGVVPPNAAGHNVYANNFTVTLDQDINVASIRTDAGGSVSAVAGGGFSNTVAGRNVTANLISGTTTCLVSSHTSGTLTLTGNSTGGAAVNAYGLSLTGAGGATVINGNVSGGTTGTGSNGVNIATVNHASLTVNGTVTGGSAVAGTSIGVSIGASTCPLTVTGAITAGTVASSNTGVVSASTGSHTFQGGVVHTSIGATCISLTGAGHTSTFTGGISGPAAGLSISSSGANITDTFTPTGAGPFQHGFSFSPSGTGTCSFAFPAAYAFPAAATTNYWTLTANAAGASITGSVAGTITSANTSGSVCAVSGVGTVNVTATKVNGSSGGASNAGIFNHTAGAFNLFSDSEGGTGSPTAHAVLHAGVAAVFKQDGIAYGCTGNSGCPAVASASVLTTGSIWVRKVQGNNYPNGPTNPAVAVNLTNNSTFMFFDEEVTGSGGVAGISGRHFIRAAASTKSFTLRDGNAGTAYVLNNTGGAADHAATTDVRDGTVYASGSRTGTLKVPPVGSVALGVQTDNTVGTAGLSPTDLLGADVIAGLDTLTDPDIVDRLTNVSTVKTTGDQLANLTSA